eukprot:GDKJ01011615.1.p1 GENE.GDKJ01011615.1~~GDKJ01011615.1.p1  ORF type:complete len:1849 (+),score=355.28 GDKJ01011615.1:112-5547(+)
METLALSVVEGKLHHDEFQSHCLSNLSQLPSEIRENIFSMIESKFGFNIKRRRHGILFVVSNPFSKTLTSKNENLYSVTSEYVSRLKTPTDDDLKSDMLLNAIHEPNRIAFLNRVSFILQSLLQEHFPQQKYSVSRALKNVLQERATLCPPQIVLAAIPSCFYQKSQSFQILMESENPLNTGGKCIEPSIFFDLFSSSTPLIILSELPVSKVDAFLESVLLSYHTPVVSICSDLNEKKKSDVQSPSVGTSRSRDHVFLISVPSLQAILLNRQGLNEDSPDLVRWNGQEGEILLEALQVCLTALISTLMKGHQSSFSAFQNALVALGVEAPQLDEKLNHDEQKSSEHQIFRCAVGPFFFASGRPYLPVAPPLAQPPPESEFLFSQNSSGNGRASEKGKCFSNPVRMPRGIAPHILATTLTSRLDAATASNLPLLIAQSVFLSIKSAEPCGSTCLNLQKHPNDTENVFIGRMKSDLLNPKGDEESSHQKNRKVVATVVVCPLPSQWRICHFSIFHAATFLCTSLCSDPAVIIVKSLAQMVQFLSDHTQLNSPLYFIFILRVSGPAPIISENLMHLLSSKSCHIIVQCSRPPLTKSVSQNIIFPPAPNLNVSLRLNAISNLQLDLSLKKTMNSLNSLLFLPLMFSRKQISISEGLGLLVTLLSATRHLGMSISTLESCLVSIACFPYEPIPIAIPIEFILRSIGLMDQDRRPSQLLLQAIFSLFEGIWKGLRFESRLRQGKWILGARRLDFLKNVNRETLKVNCPKICFDHLQQLMLNSTANVNIQKSEKCSCLMHFDSNCPIIGMVNHRNLIKFNAKSITHALRTLLIAETPPKLGEEFYVDCAYPKRRTFPTNPQPRFISSSARFFKVPVSWSMDFVVQVVGPWAALSERAVNPHTRLEIILPVLQRLRDEIKLYSGMKNSACCVSAEEQTRAEIRLFCLFSACPRVFPNLATVERATHFAHSSFWGSNWLFAWLGWLVVRVKMALLEVRVISWMSVYDLVCLKMVILSLEFLMSAVRSAFEIGDKQLAQALWNEYVLFLCLEFEKYWKTTKTRRVKNWFSKAVVDVTSALFFRNSGAALYEKVNNTFSSQKAEGNAAQSGTSLKGVSLKFLSGIDLPILLSLSLQGIFDSMMRHQVMKTSKTMAVSSSMSVSACTDWKMSDFTVNALLGDRRRTQMSAEMQLDVVYTALLFFPVKEISESFDLDKAEIRHEQMKEIVIQATSADSFAITRILSLCPTIYNRVSSPENKRPGNTFHAHDQTESSAEEDIRIEALRTVHRLRSAILSPSHVESAIAQTALCAALGLSATETHDDLSSNLMMRTFDLALHSFGVISTTLPEDAPSISTAALNLSSVLLEESSGQVGMDFAMKGFVGRAFMEERVNLGGDVRVIDGLSHFLCSCLYRIDQECELAVARLMEQEKSEVWSETAFRVEKKLLENGMKLFSVENEFELLIEFVSVDPKSEAFSRRQRLKDNLIVTQTAILSLEARKEKVKKIITSFGASTIHSSLSGFENELPNKEVEKQDMESAEVRMFEESEFQLQKADQSILKLFHFNHPIIAQAAVSRLKFSHLKGKMVEDLIKALSVHSGVQLSRSVIEFSDSDGLELNNLNDLYTPITKKLTGEVKGKILRMLQKTSAFLEFADVKRTASIQGTLKKIFSVSYSCISDILLLINDGEEEVKFQNNSAAFIEFFRNGMNVSTSKKTVTMMDFIFSLPCFQNLKSSFLQESCWEYDVQTLLSRFFFLLAKLSSFSQVDSSKLQSAEDDFYFNFCGPCAVLSLALDNSTFERHSIGLSEFEELVFILSNYFSWAK